MKIEDVSFNYKHYTVQTIVSTVDMSFKIGRLVFIQTSFKQENGGKYPVDTPLINLTAGSQRPRYNTNIPAHFRVGDTWYPYYVEITADGYVRQDFSSNTEEIIINGYYIAN